MPNPHVLRLVLGGTLLVAAASSGGHTTIFAGNDVSCETSISDGADVIGDEDALAGAIKRSAARTGADIHVVTVDWTDNSDTLDPWFEDQLRSCPTWSTGSQRASNLLVFVVGFDDRTAGIYYGDDFRRELDQTWNDIQNDIINPSFREMAGTGDITDGFLLGLAAVEAELTNDPSPVTDRRTQPSPQETTPAIPDGSAGPGRGLFLMLGGVLGAVGAVGTTGAAVVLLVRRRRAEQARLARVRHLRDTISTAALGVDQRLVGVSADVASAAGYADAGTVATWQAQLVAAGTLAEQTTTSLADAGENETMLATIVAGYTGLCSDLDALSAHCVAATHTHAAASAALTEAHAAVVAADGSLSEATSMYDVTTLVARLEVARRATRTATASLDQRRSVEALSAAIGARDEATAVRNETHALGELTARVRSRFETIESALSEARSSLVAADGADARLAARWDKDVWSEHGDSVTKGEAVLARAVTALAESRLLIDALPADPISALRLADDAENLANGVDDAADAVVARETALVRAAGELDELIADATSAAQASKVYVAEHDEVAAKVDAALKAALTELDKAISVGERGDVVQAATDAREAWSGAVGVLESAKREVARLAQVRVDLARETNDSETALRDAQQEVSAASWGSGTLGELERSLSAARSARSVDEQLRLVIAVQVAAASLEQSARRHREQVEQDRLDKIRRDRQDAQDRSDREARENAQRSSVNHSSGGGGGSTKW